MIQEQSSSQHHQQLPKYGSAGSASTGVARAPRKIKPKKIPQRGLGVAQLEKLRLEEQKKMEGGGGGHLLPPPVPLGSLPRPPADRGFSPVLWDPADPMKHHYKRMPPLPMVSTGLTLTASSSHSTEPPSNQIYGSSGSRSSAAPAPAEEDRDRPWPFMFEGMTAAPSFRTSTGKPTPTVPFPGRMVTRDAAGFADACPPPDLSSRHEFRTRNYFSSASASYSSDWSSPPDFAYCKKNILANGCAKETSLGAQQPAKLTEKPTLVIPSSAHLPECSDFLGAMPSPAKRLPSETFCGNLTGEFGLQGSTSASPSRPFYSFLPAGPVRCERAPSECSADVPEAVVDLELKL